MVNRVLVAVCISLAIVSGIGITLFYTMPGKALTHSSVVSRSNGLRMPWESIDAAAGVTLDAAYREAALDRKNREYLKSDYVKPHSFLLSDAVDNPCWDHAIPLVHDGTQWSAHFLLDAVDVVDATGEIGMVLFLADEQAKSAGTYTVRIEIVQKRPSSKIKIYDRAGTLLLGKTPMWLDKEIKTKKPYLPWQDGMKQFYSVVMQSVDGAMNILVVQHTREAVTHYTYASESVRNVLAAYAVHERLQNRPHGYLEQVSHMRCLPVPFQHSAYEQFTQATQIWVGFAQLKGTIEIVPA